MHVGFVTAAASAYRKMWKEKPKHKPPKNSFFHRFLANQHAKKLQKEREAIREQTKNFEIAKLPPEMLEIPKEQSK